MKKINYLFLGFIAALGALIFEMILSLLFPGDIARIFDQITILLILSVIIEESFKFALIFKSVSASSFFRPAFFVSLGFALTEILLAYSQNSSLPQDGLYFQLLGVGILHLTTGVISGYSARSYKKTGRPFTALLLFVLALVLHLIYNVAIIKLLKN